VSNQSADLVDRLAAALRADAADADAQLTALAARLSDAVPDAVRVDRDKAGLFSRGTGRVAAVSVALGERRWTVRRVATGIQPEVSHEVRGIRLSSEPVSMAGWTDGLARDLAALAQGSAADRAALDRLLLS